MKSRLIFSLLICLFSLACNVNAQQDESNQTKGGAQSQATEKAPAPALTTEKKPAEDNKLPAAREKAPAPTEPKPAESGVQPAQVGEQPAQPEAKPAQPGEQPAQPEAKPAQPGEQPAATSAPIVDTPEAKAGQAKSGTCTACHNADGNSTVPNWPKIAGQYNDYLIKQLKEYRMGDKGPRFEASMYAMVANLTDQDIADLAAFYSNQKQTLGKANAQLVPLGEKIYRGGNIQTGVTACLACHGPDGMGNEAAKFPRLSGQHSTYIENQLRAFKDGKRKNSPNGMMEAISRSMSDDEIKAVSSYIEGLR